MPGIIKPMHMVYLGEKAKGKLQEVRAYIGIKIGIPSTFELVRDKNYIKVEQIQESEIDRDEFKFIFSIDNRYLETFKKFINDNRSILDRFELSNPKNFQKLLEKMNEKGYRREGDIIGEKISDSRAYTMKDIGKVVVVDQSAPNIAQNIKHKIIEVNFVDGEFRREWKHNKGFSANVGDNLLFYVEEGSVSFFCDLIDKCMSAHLPGSAEPAEVLVNLGNEIITNLKMLIDNDTGLPLSLTIYPDVKSAQHAYVEVAGTIGLSPETLVEKMEIKARTEDSGSLKSDSGVSSQSEVSEDGNGQPKTEGLYPELESLKSEKEQVTEQSNVEKVAAKTALQILKGWLEKNKPIAQSNIGKLLISIDILDKRIQNGADLSSEETKNKVKCIVDIIKHGFKAEIQTLNKSYRSPLEYNIDAALKTDDDEGRFKGIIQLVDTMTKEVPDFIQVCKRANDEFNSKYGEYNTYLSHTDSLFSALVVDINFDAEKEELTSVMDSWRKNLETFIPISFGHVQSQETLSNKISEFKGMFEKKYFALQSANHAILRERLEKDVEELEISAISLPVKEDSELAEEQKQLLIKINALLTSISQAMPTNGQIKEFQAQYDSLNGNLASLKQELDRQQAVVTFYNNALFPTMSNIQAKALKLKKEGNEAADNKANRLSAVSDKVLSVKSIMDSSGNLEDIKQAISDAKLSIEANRSDLLAYRSKWGSSFFFGKILRMDLESRVTSKHLITVLNSQLDNFACQLEASSIPQFSS